MEKNVTLKEIQFLIKRRVCRSVCQRSLLSKNSDLIMKTSKNAVSLMVWAETGSLRL